MNLRDAIEGNRKTVFVVGIIALATALYIASAPSMFNQDDSGRGYNRADLMFLGMMTVHHEQAIEMSEMAPSRTNNSRILDIAANISADQKNETEIMESWLADEGLRPPRNHHRMAGMATGTEMQELNNSRGQEFDILFAELMIDHHEGGVLMARNVIRNGNSEKVKSLAQHMVDVQTREIQIMESWLEEWQN